MKAAFYTQHGNYENIKIGIVPDPEIKEDEVLVKVKAFSLNHLDIWVMEGKYPAEIPMPHVFGSDASGVVEKVGKAKANQGGYPRLESRPGGRGHGEVFV